MTMLLSAIAVSATIWALVSPMFAGEGLQKRMKAVASERERMRQRERERLNRTEKVTLRQTPKQLVQKVVEDFNLGKWLAQEEARDKLVMAGYRGQAPYTTFLFFRLVMPVAFLLIGVVYVFFIAKMQQPPAMKLAMCVGAAWLGMQAPMLFLRNAISKRQLSIRRAFPDALDLLLICVESGMSIEAAFRKVSRKSAANRSPSPRNSRSPTPNYPICKIAKWLTRTSPSERAWMASSQCAWPSCNLNVTAHRWANRCA